MTISRPSRTFLRHPWFRGPRPRGFTLIEVLIAVALLAILLFLGVPSLTRMLNNMKVRTTAQNFLSGVQTARAEAIQRNTNVEFVLTDDAPDAGNVNSATASTSGRNWLIRVRDPATGLYTLLEGKSSAEGSGRAEGEVPEVQVAGGASSLVFNGLGRSSGASTVTFRFAHSTGGACEPTGPVRCLNVVVRSGGQARLCDPAVTDPSDARAC